MALNADTGIAELAAIVSQALEAAGITATLSGGAAVSVHTHNAYESADLDFVTSAARAELEPVLNALGFTLARDRRHFMHPDTELIIEFPAAPLEFGSMRVAHEDLPLLDTAWGPLRVTTPTLCVLDRLAAWWHWSDRQCWDQAVLVAAAGQVDFEEVRAFARAEGAEESDVDRLRDLAARVSD